MIKNLLFSLLLVTISFSQTTTVVDIIVGSDNHNTLESAVIAAELADNLSGDGPFTVFAPTDDAFDALPAGTVETLLEDPTGQLADILLHHVYSGNAMSTDLSDGMMIPTLLGTNLNVSIDMNGTVMIDNAMVTVANIEADNGMVHVIDAVLIPETTTVVDIIANSDIHNTLEYALGEAGFTEYLSGEGPFTVFAPTDDAFDALPEGTLDAVLTDFELLASILKYHVVTASVYSYDLADGMLVTTLEGSDLIVTIDENGVMINDAMVTVANIEADNGVVHVIDVVLIPETETTTVVDIIVGSDDHNTLETAVIAAGLVDALSGEGPFTVFAPTDAAFDALPEGTLDAVLADMDLLTSILTHHVASGSVMSTDLSDGMMVTTLNGTELMVSISDNGVMIDNAMVTVADIIAGNGIVHVIDAVLLPSENSNIQENNSISKDYIVQTYDIYGNKVNQIKYNSILIDVYKSGKSIKKLIIN